MDKEIREPLSTLWDYWETKWTSIHQHFNMTEEEHAIIQSLHLTQSQYEPKDTEEASIDMIVNCFSSTQFTWEDLTPQYEDIHLPP